MEEVNGYNPSKDPRLINCKTECGNERCFAKRYGLFAEKKCPNYKEPSLRTNADRIRAMTDEELAEFYCNDVDACPPGSDMKCIDELYAHGEGPYPSDEQCIECWLDWLKQEELG